MRHICDSVPACIGASLTFMTLALAGNPARAETVAAPESAAPVAPAETPPPDPGLEEPMPVLNVPAMPSPEADFSADRDLFNETVTDAEIARKAEIAEGNRPANDSRLLHQRWPKLTLGTQAAGGLFGSAIVGLLGGSIGQAINAGDKRFPLGGAHGPMFGGLVGSIAGAVGGVWGAGLLFEKESAPGWTLLGAGVGTLVGAGAAAGFAVGLDEGDTATSLAVGSFLLLQVGGAVLFNDLFTRRASTGGAGKAPIAPPQSVRGPETDDPEMWLFPLGVGEF